MNAFQHYAVDLARSPMDLSGKISEESPSAIRERITLRLLSKGSATLAEVAEELGTSGNLAGAALYALTSAELVVKIPSERNAVKKWRMA